VVHDHERAAGLLLGRDEDRVLADRPLDDAAGVADDQVEDLLDVEARS
jgi:hypothetical protein